MKQVGKNSPIGASDTGRSCQRRQPHLYRSRALNDTVIGNHVIIDNLVQIAHNVKIGAGTAIAACVGIAGST